MSGRPSPFISRTLMPSAWSVPRRCTRNVDSGESAGPLPAVVRRSVWSAERTTNRVSVENHKKAHFIVFETVLRQWIELDVAEENLGAFGLEQDLSTNWKGVAAFVINLPFTYCFTCPP